MIRKTKNEKLKTKNCKLGLTNFSSLLFCFICLVCLISPVSMSLAQEDATETVESALEETEKITPSPKKDQLDKIKQLKERVAETVAKQRKENRRAHFGKIKEIAASTIILETKKGEIIVKIGEETKIFSIGLGKRKEIDLEDLEKDQSISALGFAEKEGELTPKIIIAKQKPVIINGQVIGVNVTNGTITVKTKEEEFVIDYEKTTKTKIYEKGKGLTKGGLSKIKVDDRIHVVGTENAKEDFRLTATRILVLPGKALDVVGKKETPTED